MRHVDVSVGFEHEEDARRFLAETRLVVYRGGVKLLCLGVLDRRSRRDRMTRNRIARLAAEFLLTPRILYPWPNDRFVVMHPSWKPSA